MYRSELIIIFFITLRWLLYEQNRGLLRLSPPGVPLLRAVCRRTAVWPGVCSAESLYGSKNRDLFIDYINSNWWERERQRENMAEILPIRSKTLSDQSINHDKMNVWISGIINIKIYVCVFGTWKYRTCAIDMERMRCTFLLIYFNTSFLYISIRKQQAHEAHRSSDQQFLTIDNRGKLSSYVHLNSEKKLKYFW